VGRINVSRVLLGGLAAGVVANALDFVINEYLMKAEGIDMVQRLNLPAEAFQTAMVTWIIVDFIWGLLLVFTYAGMRPRFGAGPGTAAVAGLTLWIAVTAVFAGLTSTGIYTQQAFIKSSALFLISTMAASLTGAYLYKED
jgi:hypothetical protein